MGKRLPTSAKFAVLAVVSMLSLAGPVASQQTPPTFPSGTTRGADEIGALQAAMDQDLSRSRGNASWPYEQVVAPAGMDPAVWMNFRSANLANATDTIDIDGTVTPPEGGGVHFGVQLRNQPGYNSGRRIGPDMVHLFRGLSDLDGIDLAIGLHAGGINRVRTVENLRSGSTVDLSFGDGYEMSLTVVQRPLTEGEKRLNRSTATMTAYLEKITREAESKAGGDVADPVWFSPLTNSVIRDGNEPTP